jgi:Protein of unknown function (DUF1566)
MRWGASLVFAPALNGIAAGSAGVALAECDPARPVAPATARFELHGDTVYDKTTDLTWMRCSYGQQWSDEGGCSGTARLIDWDSAMGLHLPDGVAWRLPERDELQSIVDHGCKRPAINETVFPATPSIQYWTSTPSSPSYAWIIYFRTGMPTWTFPKSTAFAVRLVHEGR